jgi:hypothetical protein
VIPYASRTGTKRNLAALRKAKWRLLVSAKGVLRNEGFPYALDNGAWSSFQAGLPFDVPAFEKAVKLLGNGADFVVVPDIVEGGLESLRFSLSWLRRLEGVGQRRLIAVQDGMTAEDVRPHLGPTVGIFLGGSTEWKLETMPQWGRLARESNAYFHVGRVNTAKRIKLCSLCGANSFDGSRASRWAMDIPFLNNARNQLPLLEVI